MPTLTAHQIAASTGGRLHGDAGRAVSRVAGAQSGGDGVLGYVASAAEQEAFRGGGFSVLIVGPDVDPTLAAAVVQLEDPRLGFAQIAAQLRPPEPFAAGVHASAVVEPSALVDGASIGPRAVVGAGARVGRGTRLGPGVVVGADAVVGRGCRLDAGVVLYAGVVLGDRVRIQSGAVLGAPGFGHVRGVDGWVDFPQLGGVEVGDDVWIGANACIAGGALTTTRVGRGARIDNLVQIGHGVVVGERACVAALAGVSGSASIGADAQLGGQVGVGPGAHVGAGAVVGGQTGVLSGGRVPAGEVWLGTPPGPRAETLRSWAVQRTLPELRRRVRALERLLPTPDDE